MEEEEGVVVVVVVVVVRKDGGWMSEVRSGGHRGKADQGLKYSECSA